MFGLCLVTGGAILLFEGGAIILDADHPKAIDVLYIEMIEAVTLVVCFFSCVTAMQAIQLWLLSSRVSALALDRTPHFLSVASQAWGIKLSGNPN
jgi:hypothetical protein